MANRDVPYGAFNYVVSFDGVDLNGGFSDVSGIGTELNISEYRDGDDVGNYVRKIPNTYKVTDVTLKRGIIDSSTMWGWINEAHTRGIEARRPAVVITMRDEAGQDVQSWILKEVLPMKYTGPTLAAKGGGEVAMEELVLCAETFEIRVPN